MKHRHAIVATMLALSVSGLALTFGTRTDQQAQARTAADLRHVGAGMFSWLTDQVGAAAAGQSQVPVDLNNYPVISPGDLESLLVPTYLAEVPELDGWNRSYDFRFNVANPLAQHIMAARSPGRDGNYAGTSYIAGRFAPDSFDEDLVWADGFTVRWPGSRTDREAQDQTVDDIRSIGAAMFSWLTDQVAFTGRGPSKAQESSVINLALYSGVSHAQLESLLTPQYLPRVPERDGWGSFYRFYLDVKHPLTEQVMAIVSGGGDQSQWGDIYLVTQFDRDDFDQDIVWADGSFVRWPDEDGLSFYPLPPCRIFDSRPDAPLQSGVSSQIQLGGACEIPVSAKSVAVSVTVVNPTGVGYLTLFPSGLPAPTTSTITFAAGQTRANSTVLGLSQDGIGSIGALPVVAGGGQVHLVLDVNGYFD